MRIFFIFGDPYYQVVQQIVDVDFLGYQIGQKKSVP